MRHETQAGSDADSGGRAIRGVGVAGVDRYARPSAESVDRQLIRHRPDFNGNQTNGAFRIKSFAAPHLSGMIALLLKADLEVSPWTQRQILMDTARDIGEPGLEYGYGTGLVDAYAALQRLKSGVR